MRFVVFLIGFFPVVWLSCYISNELRPDLIGELAVGAGCGLLYGLIMPRILYRD